MEKKITSLTLKEKAMLLSGYKTMETYSIKEKGIEPIFMSDGPCGIRKEDINGNSLNNISKTLPATCFPAGVTIASTWNKDLLNQMGKQLGKECNHFNINVLLAPAVNIQRNPLCGRNFEYLSEDPYLSGKLGAAIVKGIQLENVAACIKHYACNNNEKYRFIGDSIVDLKALHEIYLKPFEIITKEANPYAIMTAYNKVNGVFCSENKYLIEDTLRNTFGFNGLVMTDWGGIVNRDVALKNGLDLEMPGMNIYNNKLLYDSVINKKINEELLDKSISRILELKERTRITKKDVDFNESFNLSLKLAVEGAVLLKNKDNILPLNKEEKYLIVGDLFNTIRYQGSGSSMINPILLKDHKEAFKENNINYEYLQGYSLNDDNIDIKKEDEVVSALKNYDKVILYCGLNDYVESEGFDRDNMSLPKCQLSLINRLIKQGKSLILVLFTGSPVELPFIDDCDAILNMMLPGEACGLATTKLLFGLENPSGKLTESWPIKYEDIPFSFEFTKTPNELYKESIFVGYRYYETIKKEVLFPFGFGLSYTKFSYSNLNIKKEDDKITLSFLIKNIGNYKGKEITQIYIGKKDSNIIRPNIELKGFIKTSLDINEEKEVSISLLKDDFKIYFCNEYVIEDGMYQIYVNSSSKDIMLMENIKLDGKELNPGEYDVIYDKFIKTNSLEKNEFEKVIKRPIIDYEFNKKPYTLETPIGEFNTFFGKIFKNVLCNVGLKKYKKASKIKDNLLREREKKAGLFIYKLMPNNCLRSLSFSASGMFDYNLAEGILELSNGHFFKGIKKILKKYKIKEKKKE